MRTTPTAKAGATPPVTPEQRRIIILAKLEKITSTYPASVEALTYGDIYKLAEDTHEVRRMGRAKKSPLPVLLRIGGRIARCYGVTMEQIDPCHGEAA